MLDPDASLLGLFPQHRRDFNGSGLPARTFSLERLLAPPVQFAHRRTLSLGYRIHPFSGQCHSIVL